MPYKQVYYALSAVIACIISVAVALYKMELRQLVIDEKPFMMTVDYHYNNHLSSKANYDFGKYPVELPKYCHIVHTETIQRHGARHLNKIDKMDKVVKYFEDLQKKNMLMNDTYLNWAKDLLSWEESNVGTLCKTGEIEIAEIAKRARERLKLDEYKKGDFIVENTFKKRTQQTRDIFLDNFLPEDYARDQIHQVDSYSCKDLKTKRGAVNRTVFDNYSPIRYFSVCPNYSRYKNSEKVKKELKEAWYDNMEIFIMLHANPINLRVFRNFTEVDVPTMLALYQNLYLMCQVEASCYNIYDRSCALLNTDRGIFEQMGYQDDLKLYTLKGIGNMLNVQMSCPLGKSIMNGIGANYLHNEINKNKKKEFVEKYGSYFQFDSEPPSRGHLRFGHAESILPLFRLFIMHYPREVFNPISFSGAAMVPMSANFQIDLVECQEKYYIQFLINELPAQLSTNSGPAQSLYPMEEFFDAWLRQLKNLDLGTCSYDDFERLCSTPSCCIVCSSECNSSFVYCCCLNHL